MTLTPPWWNGKRCLVTGHTGFKGSWLVALLHRLGTSVSGIALPPAHARMLHETVALSALDNQLYADLSHPETYRSAIEAWQPEIVFHLAAQPLVRTSYDRPFETIQANVMGTAGLLEVLRKTPSVRAIVVVTTDKVYSSKEDGKERREQDSLGGFDPYSASKSCVELLTASYRDSFFRSAAKCGLATARAGNVIGGGDFSTDRLIPDCVRAVEQKQPIRIRAPHAVRPWQHVFESLSGYVRLAEALFQDPHAYSTSWNFGPRMCDCRPVADLVADFSARLGPLAIEVDSAELKTKHETQILLLDSSETEQKLRWKPRWSIDESLEATASWYRTAYSHPTNLQSLSDRQLKTYFHELTPDAAHTGTHTSPLMK